MIAVDSNVLLRYLLDDDRAQSPAAARLITDALEQDEEVFVGVPVTCETIWVLTRLYKLPLGELKTTFSRLLEEPPLRFERETELRSALRSFRRGSAGLVDLLIAEIARSQGCRTVYTFDRTLRKTKGFREPQ